MCKRTMCVILGMILIMTSIASAELVAHWRLDDGSGMVAVDSSGNGHDGTLVLDPQWVAGRYDGALEFGGISGQRVEIEGYDGVLGTQNRTIMGWVKTAELGDWISYGQNVTSQKWIGRINDNESNGAVGALRTECSGGYIISTTVLTDDEWHHLVSVLESDGAPTIFDISMYVDGTLEEISGSKVVDVNTVGERNVWIADGHHDRPLPSVIDDVRIYDHAMTKLEILAVMADVEQIDMEIGYCMTPPVIDGEVDGIWAVSSTQAFVPLEDPADGSGTWQVLYDEENLYVIVDVTDDSLQNDSSSAWQDDSVEIYFDGGNTKLDTPLSGDDHQYTFGWTADDIQGTNIAGYTDGIEQAQVTTDTGWRIEVKMPWISIWGVVPEAHDLIGIDCYYNDDDDGGDSREGKMLSYSAVEGWNDASQWATAILAVAPEPVDPGSSGLLALWTCDEGEGAVVGDASGNGRDGTFVNGDPSWVEGVQGSAVELIGPTLIETPPLDLELTEATMAGWILPYGPQPDWSSIVMQRDPGLATGFNILGYQLAYHWNDTSDSWSFRGGDMIAEEEWTFAAVTVDPDKAQFYVNGLPGSVNEIAHEPCLWNSNVYLGGDGTEGWVSRRMVGALDNILMYDRALSANEILYLAGYRAAPDVEANKEIARRFFEEMWNLRNLDIVEELISADMQGHAPTGEFVGYEGERQTILGTVEAFPDLQITIDDIIAEDNKVALLTSYHGTHTGTLMGQIPPTGAEVAMTGGVLFHFAEGKIVEAWSFADMLGLMQQIGAVTPPRPAPQDYTWLPSSQITGDPGNPESNKELVIRFVEEVWNQRNLEPIKELFHPEIIGNNPAVTYMYMPANRETFTQSIADYLAAYPDMNVTIHDMVAEDDKVLAHWSVNATHGGELMGIPPTGNPVTFSGHTMYRFADGQIVETWWTWDTMGMMQQITPTEP